MLETPRREGNPPTQLRASIKRATEEAAKPKTRATTPSGNPTPRCTYGKSTFQKDTGTPTFTAKLLTTAKARKHPNCPSTHQWIQKVCYIPTMGYYSAIKKNEIMSPAVTWMDLEMITLSKSDRERQISYDITYRHYPKNEHNWNNLTHRNRLPNTRSKLMLNHSVMSHSLRPPWTVARQIPLSLGILQARILEWVAIPSCRGSSQPRDWTQVSRIAGGFFTVWATRVASTLTKWKVWAGGNTNDKVGIKTHNKISYIYIYRYTFYMYLYNVHIYIIYMCKYT